MKLLFLVALLAVTAAARDDRDFLGIAGQPAWLDVRDNDAYLQHSLTGTPPSGFEALEAWAPLEGLVRNHRTADTLDATTGAISGTPAAGWSWEDSFTGTGGGASIPVNHAAFADQFGAAVELLEDAAESWVFIAAPTESTQLPISGAVYIYRRSGAPHDWRWQFHQKLSGWNAHNLVGRVAMLSPSHPHSLQPGSISLAVDFPWLVVGHQRDGNIYRYRYDAAQELWLASGTPLTGSTEVGLDASENRLFYMVGSEVRFARLDAATEAATLPTTVTSVSDFFYARQRKLLYIYKTSLGYDLRRPWASNAAVVTTVAGTDVQCASKDRLWVRKNDTALNLYLYDLANDDYRNGTEVSLAGATGALTSLACSDDWLIVGWGATGAGSVRVYQETGSAGLSIDTIAGPETNSRLGSSLSNHVHRFVPLGAPSCPQAHAEASGFSLLAGRVSLYSAVPWFRTDEVQNSSVPIQWTYDDLSRVSLVVHSDPTPEPTPEPIVVGSPLRARNDRVAAGHDALIDPTANDMVRGPAAISLCSLPGPESLSTVSILPGFSASWLSVAEPDSGSAAWTAATFVEPDHFVLASDEPAIYVMEGGFGDPLRLIALTDRLDTDNATAVSLSSAGGMVAAALQDSDMVRLYTVDQESGEMTAGKNLSCQAPSWVHFQDNQLLLVGCQASIHSHIITSDNSTTLTARPVLGDAIVRGSAAPLLASLLLNRTRLAVNRWVQATDTWLEEAGSPVDLPGQVLDGHLASDRLALLFTDGTTVHIHSLRHPDADPIILELSAPATRIELLNGAGYLLYASPAGELWAFHHNDTWVQQATGVASAGDGLMAVSQTRPGHLVHDQAAGRVRMHLHRPLLHVENQTVGASLCYYLTDSVGDGRRDRALVQFVAEGASIAQLLSAAVLAATPVVRAALVNPTKAPEWTIIMIVVLAALLVVAIFVLTALLYDKFLRDSDSEEEEDDNKNA